MNWYIPVRGSDFIYSAEWVEGFAHSSIGSMQLLVDFDSEFEFCTCCIFFERRSSSYCISRKPNHSNDYLIGYVAVLERSLYEESDTCPFLFAFLNQIIF